MKDLNTMTSDERNLLLYLETCAVNRGGLVDAKRMNKEEMDMAKKWNDEKFIKFGRIKSHLIIVNSHWCEFTEEAWKLAHAERKARCVRLMSKQFIDKVGG